MKFQNPSFKFFLNGRMDARRDGQTHGQAKSNMLPTLSKLRAQPEDHWSCKRSPDVWARYQHNEQF